MTSLGKDISDFFLHLIRKMSLHEILICIIFLTTTFPIYKAIDLVPQTVWKICNDRIFIQWQKFWDNYDASFSKWDNCDAYDSSYLDHSSPNILTSSSEACASKALNSVDPLLSVKTDNRILEIYSGFSRNILIKLKVYICQKKMSQAPFLA